MVPASHVATAQGYFTAVMNIAMLLGPLWASTLGLAVWAPTLGCLVLVCVLAVVLFFTYGLLDVRDREEVAEPDAERDADDERHPESIIN